MRFWFAASTGYGKAVAAETVQLPLDSRTITAMSMPLGQAASMMVLHADGTPEPDVNDNSLVVRLDLGATSVLLMGDAPRR